MSLTSLTFLVFLTVLTAAYYVLPAVCQWMLLLIASFVFYYFAGGLSMFSWLIYGILVTCVGGRVLEKQPEGRRKTLLTGLFVVLALVPLFLLKYIRFFGFRSPFGVIAPLGISFYTMTIIGYVVDVARGTMPAQRNVLKHALFTGYFPQLTSGPILSYSEMEPQLFAKHTFSYERAAFGAQRICWGFFKKLVIAERLGRVVDATYGNYEQYPGAYLFIGTLCFAFQLYTDFGGCMDIILGASEILGITLPENFDTPFFARNISEYWRRWHITLGVWFKNYFFYPLLKSPLMVRFMDWSKKKYGKKKGKKLPTYAGMFILWFATGMWHGGSWNFIIGSGLLHWFYIVSGELLAPTFKKLITACRINAESALWHFWQSLRTFLLACLGFVFFRAPSLKTALFILKNMFGKLNVEVWFDGSLLEFMELSDWLAAIAGLLVLLVVSILKYRGTDVRKTLAEKALPLRWAVYILLFVSVLIFGCYGGDYNAASFIYANF